MAKVSELQHQAIHFGLNAFHRYSVHARSILLCLTMRSWQKKCKIPRCKTHSKWNLLPRFQDQAKIFHYRCFQGTILYPSASGNIPLRISPGTCLWPFWENCKTTPGEKWYFHMWTLQALEQGIKLNLHLWKMSIFYFILTDWNRVKFVPWEAPFILDQA